MEDKDKSIFFETEEKVKIETKKETKVVKKYKVILVAENYFIIDNNGNGESYRKDESTKDIKVGEEFSPN